MPLRLVAGRLATSRWSRCQSTAWLVIDRRTQPPRDFTSSLKSRRPTMGGSCDGLAMLPNRFGWNSYNDSMGRTGCDRVLVFYSQNWPDQFRIKIFLLEKFTPNTPNDNQTNKNSVSIFFILKSANFGDINTL